MATAWYYTIKGQKQGPVSSQQLKELADQRVLSPSDMVWKDGMAEWAAASKIKGLFPERALIEPPDPPLVKDPALPVVVKMSTPVHIAKPKQGILASIAKWTTIGWSVLCLFFLFSGLSNVSSVGSSDAEKAGAVIGVGCGMGVIFVIWAAVALPAAIIWVVSRKS